MKLARIRVGGAYKPALLLSGSTYADISAAIPDIDSVHVQPFAMQRVIDRLPDITGDGQLYPRIENPPAEAFGPVVSRPPNIIGIGLNYNDHCTECGYPVPSGLEVFLKHSGSICAPNHPLRITPNMIEVDYEVELALVIGKANVGRVDASHALELLAGYALANDVSERKYQMSGKNWTRGKGFACFSPIGPWLVTPDEIENPQDLDLVLSVNGEPRQRSNTNRMIFGVAQILARLSETFSLLPGDVVLTGTPSGVCFRPMYPKPYLKAGDEVIWGISKLGEARHTIVAQ